MPRRLRLGSARRYEELLDGARADDRALSDLLAAARAPGTRDEVAGLATARTEFLNTRFRPIRGATKSLPAATRTAARRLLVLKAVAALSGATLIGGTAYAATGTDLLGGSSKDPAPRHGSSSSTHGTHSRDGSRRVSTNGSRAGGRQAPAQPEASTNGHPGGLSSSAGASHSPPATPSSTQPNYIQTSRTHPVPTPGRAHTTRAARPTSTPSASPAHPSGGGGYHP